LETFSSLDHDPSPGCRTIPTEDGRSCNAERRQLATGGSVPPTSPIRRAHPPIPVIEESRERRFLLLLLAAVPALLLGGCDFGGDDDDDDDDENDD
jgi:hypothetical protein